MSINVRQPSAAAWMIGLALALVYGVWGTTYLAIQWVLVAMPPWTQNGWRFVLAGALMLAWARWRGAAWPSARQWRHAALAGVLMSFCAMGLVVWAQKLGIGSGLMATVVTTMPMWLALWGRLSGEHTPLTSWLGLGLGVLGAALLALEGDFSASGAGALAAFAAPLCWSLGSHAARRLPQPEGAMAPAAQWLSGGLVGVAVAAVLEPGGLQAMWRAPLAAQGAWIYLLVAGTLLALNAYLWLLQHTPPALAGSYAFVNPVVALAVGVWLGREILSGWVWLALPLMLLALGLILRGPALRAWWSRARPVHLLIRRLG